MLSPGPVLLVHVMQKRVARGQTASWMLIYEASLRGIMILDMKFLCPETCFLVAIVTASVVQAVSAPPVPDAPPTATIHLTWSRPLWKQARTAKRQMGKVVVI